MPLSTYAELKTEILGWLARPGDVLVEPAVPDFIRLFEAEATRRLKVRWAEKQAVLTTVAGNPGLALPSDFGELRHLTVANLILAYVPPALLMGGSGPPRTYTIHANQLRLGPTPDAVYEVQILYQTGVPPLSESNQTNWLLTEACDCYLWGALTEAELYIGHDERAATWAARREAVFASLELADRKARWPANLQIKADGITAAHGGGGASWADGAESPGSVTASGTVRVANPGSGTVVSMLPTDRVLYVAGGPRDALTIRLPASAGMIDGEDTIEISFEQPVTALTLTDSTGGAIPEAPDSAYGPGAGLLLRWVPSEGWLYWK